MIFVFVFLYFVFVFSIFNFIKTNIYKIRDRAREGGWGVEVLLNCPGHLKPINDKYPLVIFSNTAVAARPRRCQRHQQRSALKGRKQILFAVVAHTTTTAGSHLCPCRCPHSAESESERWRREKKCCQTSKKKKCIKTKVKPRKL